MAGKITKKLLKSFMERLDEYERYFRQCDAKADEKPDNQSHTSYLNIAKHADFMSDKLEAQRNGNAKPEESAMEVIREIYGIDP